MDCNRYEPDLNSGCWLFNGSLHRLGYGRIKKNGRVQYAHRIAWIEEHGAIPEGIDVCHKCDTPACVRVSHLFLGTHQDNMDDKVRKGRAVASSKNRLKGTDVWSAKLTPSLVFVIRTDPRLHREIAEDYGVSRVAITNIKNRKSWNSGESDHGFA